MATSVYSKFKQQCAQGAHNLASDTLKMMLLTSSYTPALDTDAQYSDISANEVTGTGYTAGGATLSGQAVTLTAANSWGVSRAANTAYTVGQIARPSTGNGYVYKCVAA